MSGRIEPTFDDIMSGFGLDSGTPLRRRLIHGRRRNGQYGDTATAQDDVTAAERGPNGSGRDDGSGENENHPLRS